MLAPAPQVPRCAAGQGDLAELARAGAGILAPPAQQGGMSPFMRQALSHALFAGAGGATVAGRKALSPAPAVGAGLPKVAGTLLRAPPVQSYLKNQVAPGIGRDPNISKLAAALAAYAPAARR
jgi:hypothetical protein